MWNFHESFNTEKKKPEEKKQLPAAPSRPLFISFPISSWLLLLILIRLHKFFAEKSILAIPAIGKTKIKNLEI